MDSNIIDGKWKVVALYGAAIMNQLNDTKVIFNGRGYNQFEGTSERWGFFNVEQGPRGVVLNYDHSQNLTPLRLVRDHMEKVGDHWKGELRFAGKVAFKFELHPFGEDSTEQVATTGDGK